MSAPSPTTVQESITTWDGPDDAVSTWLSAQCNREVLAFGAQQYEQAGVVGRIPTGVEYLGYHLGERRLFGDRGAPNTLYVSADGGRTYQEWLAVDSQCSP
ncbi:MAG: hypothetical protein ABIS18_10200 [Actinomycetota bacterium]